MSAEGHFCWESCDEGPHGCVCGNDCPPSVRDYTPTTEEIAGWWAHKGGSTDSPYYASKLTKRVKEFDRWLAAHDAAKRAEWDAAQGDKEALTEKELYELPNLSMVLRSWPNSPVPDTPEVYQKRGGWWLDLTDRNDDYERSLGVIWSDVARFTAIHAPVPDTTNNESEDG